MKRKFYSFLLALLLLACSKFSLATTDTISAGSFIVNMGVVPQTIGNGLKPYGMIYDLLKNYKVPVKWAINPSKVKDGIDFSHNGVDYRGGTFIIPFEFRTPAINAVIASWQAQGVVGATSVSTFTTEVYKTIYYAPNWTMDKYNGFIAVAYFNNAGIPSSAYGGDTANWKTPAQLGPCDDIFVLPHADPTWATHQNLYYWNLNHKGNIWAGCHGASEIENLRSPDNSIKMNFLTTAGLAPTATHKKHSSPPFLYNHPADFVMQFMGKLDNATANGSEREFYPLKGSNWRSTTAVGVYDIVDEFIPSISDGPAGVVAYGRAYGDNNRGWVMYEAGHSLADGGTTAEKVAAQRAFFNYSFSVAVDRLTSFKPTISGLSPVLVANNDYNLSFTVPPGIDLSYYTIQWTSSCGGAFSPDANTQDVVFKPGYSVGSCIVTLTLTDGCGRQYFQSEGVFISSVLPVSGTGLRAYFNKTTGAADLQWSCLNNSAINHFEVQRSEDGRMFKTIAIVFSNGHEQASYRMSDKQAITGNVYYRIKAVGSTANFSPLVRLSTTEAQAGQLIVLSNPVRSDIKFEYNSGKTQNLQVQLIAFNGAVVMNKMLAVKEGINILSLPNAQLLQNGAYVLRVQGDQQIISAKLSIVR